MGLLARGNLFFHQLSIQVDQDRGEIRGGFVGVTQHQDLWRGSRVERRESRITRFVLGELRLFRSEPVEAGQRHGRRHFDARIEFVAHQRLAQRHHERLGILGARVVDAGVDQREQQSATCRGGGVQRVDIGLDLGLSDHDADVAAALDVARLGRDVVVGDGRQAGARQAKRAHTCDQHATAVDIHLESPARCYSLRASLSRLGHGRSGRVWRD